MKNKGKDENKLDEYKGIKGEDVQKELESWDKVVCAICQKKISLLDAKFVNNGSTVICKRGH